LSAETKEQSPRDVALDKLIVTVSPHIRDADSVTKIMWRVAFALLPAWLWSWAVFGYYAAVVVTGLAVAAAVATEAIVQRLRRRPVTVADGSAVVTGLLLAFVLPPNSPWYVPVVGSVFAVAIVKHCFGGLGHNIWNPALAGRAFVHFAYPAVMNQSAWPMLGRWFAGNVAASSDAVVTSATPLGYPAARAAIGLESAADAYPIWKLAVGAVPGCIGEVCKIALLAGLIYLIVKKTVDWRVPLTYVLTVFVFSLVFPYASVLKSGEPMTWTLGLNFAVYQVLAGGLFIGAFFMATDMVTTPLTPLGGVIFAFGCGVLTALIRMISSGFPEGVCFSILIMNTVTPLIDRWTRPRILGT